MSRFIQLETWLNIGRREFNQPEINVFNAHVLQDQLILSGLLIKFAFGKKGEGTNFGDKLNFLPKWIVKFTKHNLKWKISCEYLTCKNGTKSSSRFVTKMNRLLPPKTH